MRNIHTIATDKPSRLYYNNNDKMLQFCELCKESTPLKENRNIYIISDDKIVEGDYGLGFALGIRGTGRGHFVFKQDGTNVGKVTAICDGSKKIIITTDEELISEGVQKIDDYFLQWFIVNSSCEIVELEKTKRRFVHNVGGITGHVDNYKIIIPSEEVLLQSSIDGEAIWGEEQKQHLIDIIKSDEDLELYEEPKQTDEKGKPMTYWGGLEKPKQETLEQIDKNEDTIEFELLQQIKFSLACNNEAIAIRLIEQFAFRLTQELYSKEDMKLAIKFGADGLYGYQMGEEGYDVNQIKRFLEQFKK